ncbi:MAG TPA: hypothetical protein VK864_09465 [Longimicrobiales bacterium]|nr:hypothetical protein [Longimicrobiales bacterium]
MMRSADNEARAPGSSTTLGRDEAPAARIVIVILLVLVLVLVR